VKRRGVLFWCLVTVGTVTGLSVILKISFGGPVRQPHDLCAVFDQKFSWYKAAKRTREEWGMPEPVLMAVIYHESSYRADVRPPRKRYLWVIPGPRPSTAYGYAQVLDTTWQKYQEVRGGKGAERDDFDDVADFVGWYGDVIRKETGIALDDAYRFYLAYHEGPRGYVRRSYRSKPVLLATAQKVEERAQKYARQYEGCRKRLEGRWF